MENMTRVFVLMILAVGISFGQVMPSSTNQATPARTGNAVCPGSTGTVAMVPTQVSTLAISVQTGALICTTPTATQLCALFPRVGSTASDFHWDWYLINGGTGTVTVGLGTAVSGTSGFTGTLTVAAGSVKHFMFVLTNCVAGTQAAQLISLGTSVF